MRILVGVHQFFPVHYTGTERYVLNLSKQLQKLGHYVKVLTYAFREEENLKKSEWSNLLKKEYSYEGVPVVALRHLQQPDDLNFVFDFMDMDIYEEVTGIIKNEGFDIYHCAHPLRIASSVKAAKDCGLKVIFMLTDYFMMCPMGIMLRTDNTLCNGPAEGFNCIKYCFTNVTQERVRKRFSESRLLISNSDILLSPSKFLIGMFDYTGFIPMSRFILCRHGFDYSRKKQFIKAKKSKVITFGYIGTIQYHKGVHIMIDAFKKVKFGCTVANLGWMFSRG
jgi:glycosyltransferase involved in cell wall biosynthesis